MKKGIITVMVDVFSYLIAFFITVPIIASMLIFIIARKIVRHPLKAIHISVNLTNVLYFISVILLLEMIIGRSFFMWIVLLFLLAMITMVIYQWKKNTEVQILKGLKVIWRASFLLFFTLYIVLLIVGITVEILK